MKKLIKFFIPFVFMSIWITNANTTIQQLKQVQLNTNNISEISVNIKDIISNKIWDKKYKTMLLKLYNYINQSNQNNYYSNSIFLKDNSAYLDISKLSVFLDKTKNITINLQYEMYKYFQENNYNLEKLVRIIGKAQFVNDVIIAKYAPWTINCKIKNVNILTYSLLKILWKNIKVDANKLVLCWLKWNINKYYYKYELPTKSKPYRVHNITKWLDIMSWWFKQWETISTVRKLFDADKNKDLYVDGYIIKSEINWSWNLIYEDNIKAYWWGLCWVSTALYQTVMNIKGIDIVKRSSHSIWYYWLYWHKVWQDATIFWADNWTPRKDFVIKNNIWWDIYLKWIHYKKWYKFITWFEVYSYKPLDIDKTIYLGRRWKCWYNKIHGKIVKSCYSEIK